MVWPSKKVGAYCLSSAYILTLDMNYPMSLFALPHFSCKILQGLYWLGEVHDHHVVEFFFRILRYLDVVLFVRLDQVNYGQVGYCFALGRDVCMINNI